MQTIGFHSNQLGIRGTEVALYDYALYNEEILGNKSYIISSSAGDLQTLGKFQKRFEVFLYESFKDTFKFAENKQIDSMYFIKAGDNDGKLMPYAKNLIHAVFQNKQPHGDRYAYVSQWLAEQMGIPQNYIPHIVQLPAPQKSYRSKLNISQDSIIIGRHGGFNDFDLPFAHSAIYKALECRKDLFFVFMNTRPFGPAHSNILFVDGTYNLQHKSDYINTCDYMLHARQHGESFGLAISEFLFHDKPVISWSDGLDKNHIRILGNKGLWYQDKSNAQAGIYKDLVKEFAPNNVMNKFKEVFLK